MANRIITIGGDPLITTHGVVLTEFIATAPNNEALGQTITIWTPSNQNAPRYLVINLPAPLSGSFTGFRLVGFGTADAEYVTVSWAASADKLAELQANSGDILLGDMVELFGSINSALALQTYQIVLKNANGEGTSAAVSFLFDSEGAPLLAPEVVSCDISGPGVAGEVHTAVVVATGTPDPTITYQWYLDGVLIGGATDSTYTPNTAGLLTVIATATNSVTSDSLESAAVNILTLPAVSNVVIVGSGQTGTVHTATFNMTGNPAPTASFVWEDDGTPIPGAIGVTYIPPAGQTGNLTVVVTGTNTQGSHFAESAAVAVTDPGGGLTAPVITNLNITSSGTVGLKGVAQTASVVATGNPTPTFTYQWNLNGSAIVGATSASYTPTQNSGSLTVTVVATNSQDSDTETSGAVTILSAPTVSGHSISGSGVVGAVHTAVATITGSPTPTTTYQWKNDGVAISGATNSTFTPTVAGTLSVVITSSNAHGSASQEPTKVITAPTALTASEWSILTVAAAPDINSTARRMTKIGISLGKNATRAWYTSSSASFLAANPFPAGWTELTIGNAAAWQEFTVPASFGISAAPGSTNVGNGVCVGGVSRVTGPSTITLTATSATSFTISGIVTGTATVGTEFVSSGGTYRFTVVAGTTAFTPGDTFVLTVGDWDFSCFDPNPPGTRTADNDRQGRIGLVYAVSTGARSPISADLKTVPNVPTTTTHTWYPLLGRSATQFAAGVIGGKKTMQNFKCWARTAANPNLMWQGLDVNGPVKTDNDGDWWKSPACHGVQWGASAVGLWIDPEDEDRIVYITSAASDRSSTTTPNEYDLLSGIHFSEDGGENFTLVRQLTNVASTGMTGERDNLSNICHALNGNESPTTRTVYYAHKPRPRNGSWLNGTLYRSTNGGETWGIRGSAGDLTNAIFGNRIYMLDCDPDGNLYAACDNGVKRLAVGSTTWTNCTGITGQVVVVNAYHGGANIWAGKDGDGAYKANAAGTAFTKNANLGTYNLSTLSVCPADPDRILVAAKAGSVLYKYTTNGGLTANGWHNGVSRDFDGGTTEFQARIWGEKAKFAWKPGSTTHVIAQGGDNFLKSTDGGANFFWSADGANMQTAKGMGFDLDDWQVILMGTQDSTAAYTDTGMNHEYDGELTASQKTTVIGSGGASRGAGALILKNGAHKARITACGGDVQERTPLLWTTSGGNPLGTATIMNSSQRSGCWHSHADYTDRSVGWMGYNRFKLSAGGVASIQKLNMAQEFLGVSSTSLRIFGANKAGSSNTIFVSPDGGDSWSTWGTSPVRFRHVAGYPLPVWVSKFSANRVYVGEGAKTGTGRVFRMEGASPTNTLILTVANLPSFTSPFPEVMRVVECPNDATVLYVLVRSFGSSIVYRVTDALTTPVVTDITGNLPQYEAQFLYVHPLTDDVIVSSEFPQRILRCHAGSTAPNAGALFDRTKTYVDANLGPGVQL